MVLLTACWRSRSSIYAIGSGWDARGRHFHALLMFQIMGISGAFLTGDIFNLFVFFEVLLIASYGLMIHGGGKDGSRRACNTSSTTCSALPCFSLRSERSTP